MISAHVQQTGSHFVADRGVVGGVGVNWLRRFFAECAALFGLIWTLLWIKIVVRVTYGLSVEKAKQLATLWGQLGERLGQNLEEADGKFDSSFDYPPFPTKYSHGRIRNDSNVGSVCDLICGGCRVRTRSQSTICRKKLVSGSSQKHRSLWSVSLQSLQKHKIGETQPTRFRKRKPVARFKLLRPSVMNSIYFRNINYYCRISYYNILYIYMKNIYIHVPYYCSQNCIPL